MADSRLRRELRSVEKAIRQRQTLAGQWLQWYQIDYANTTSDPVYSTGPSRKWLAPVTIPAYSAWISQAPQSFGDDGLYLVDRLQAVVSVWEFEHRGMTLFTDDHHLNDRVMFDGELFSVDSFIPGGRVADRYMTIAISALQVKPEEFEEEDNQPWSE